MKHKDKLLSLLNYANEHCIYYSRLFKENNVNINNLDDFTKIPFLTKKDIQNNENEIISSDYNIDTLILERTSGSSGVPLNCRYDKNERLRRSLALWGERKKNSSKIMGKKMVNFHGGNRSHNNKSRNSFIDKEKDTLYINYLNMGEKYLQEIFEALLEFKPYFIRCQSSILFEIIQYCKKNNKSTINLGVKYIEVGQEYLFDSVFNALKEAFPEAEIGNNYGAQEFYCIAYSCENNCLHILDDYLHVETVNEDAEGYGEIVITSLYNNAMPFIRYKLGDIGKIKVNTCKCGRNSKMLELKSGRTSEFFKYNSEKVHGNIFKNCVESYNLFKHKIVINQFQVHQVSERKFKIIIVSNENDFSDELETYIEAFFAEKVDIRIDATVEISERLEINPISGKLKTYNFL